MSVASWFELSVWITATTNLSSELETLHGIQSRESMPPVQKYVELGIDSKDKDTDYYSSHSVRR